MSDRLEHVRAVHDAFASGECSVIEPGFTEDFRFSSPLDVDLDRAGYFERCWPGPGRGQEFEFVRLIESGDEDTMPFSGENTRCAIPTELVLGGRAGVGTSARSSSGVYGRSFRASRPSFD
jgi:hypothetical protein